jgi:hypothetical protein
MKRLKMLAVLFASSALAVPLASLAQSSTIYDFSYTMTNGGHVITGSFVAGANNGLFVDTSAITAISVTFDGQLLNGPMLGNYYDPGWVAADPVVSFAYNQNAFIFSNCSVRDCSAGPPPDLNYLVVRHSNGDQNVDVFINNIEYSDNYPNTSWALSAQPVPEPGKWATMSVGLLLLASAKRKRLRAG